MNIPQEAIEAANRALRTYGAICMGSDEDSDYQASHDKADEGDVAKSILEAAAPHLEAAWRAQVKGEIEAEYLGPDFGRNPTNGQDPPSAELAASYDQGLADAARIAGGGS